MQRLVLGLVAVALGIALVVVVLAVTGDDDSAAFQPPYAVLKTEDAALAVEGGDYEVVHELSPEDGSHVEAILPDGELVMTAHDRASVSTVVEVLDPGSGDRESLPSPWAAAGELDRFDVTSATAEEIWVSWDDRHYGDRRPAAMRYDRATGEHEVIAPPDVPHHERADYLPPMIPAADDRVYFMTGRYRCGDGECSGPEHAELWSFDPDAPDDGRREGAAVAFAVAGSLLAWQEGPATVHVRDLATGEENMHTVPCEAGTLSASATVVVAACDAGRSRYHVLDAEAEPLAELRIPWSQTGSGALAVGDRWVAVGPFAYDTRTGRLLRLYEYWPVSSGPPVTTGDLSVAPYGLPDPREADDDAWDTWALVRLLDKPEPVGEAGARAERPVQCWDGKRSYDFEPCRDPHGRDGMAWMFPGSDEPGCRDVGVGLKRPVNVWCRDVELTGGGRADLHYSEWKLSRGMRRSYEPARLRRLPAPQPGTRALELEVEDGFKAVVYYTAWPADTWSVTIYADTRGELEAALGDLELRPRAEQKGATTS